MKRMFPMILLFALLLCVPVRADELTLDAPSALLMEKQTGTVLFAKDEHTPREPASVTKVMTLLLTMEAIDSGALSYDDTVTGSAHAASMGGSQIWLKEGEQMRVEDLIKAVCVVSGNDAAVALGTQKTVQSVLTSENALLLEKSRANGLTQAVSLPERIDAPVEEGEPLGTLDIFDADGTPVASLPLLAGESIPHLTWSKLFCRLLKLAYCGA